MEKTDKSLLTIKLTAAGLLILVLLIIHTLSPTFFSTIWQLSTSGSMTDTIEYLQSFGAWAIFISFLIDILINALGFLPSIFISTANGVLFGLGIGILISWLAECIGVIISFILMRTFLRDYAEKILQASPYLKKVDDFSSTNGFKMMLFARSLPYFPSGIITALGALSQISLKDYILANLIGKFPSTALEVIIGHDAVNYQENLLRLTILVIGITVVYGGIWWYQRKKSTPK